MKDFGPCLKGVWRLLRTVRWKVLLSAFLQTVAAAASLAFVWFSKRVVDIATGHLEGELSVAIWLLVGIMALQVLTRVFVKYYEGRITVAAKNRIRSDVFAKALRSTWTGRDKFHSADMANRMEEDIRVVTEFICCDIPEAFVTCLQLVAAVVMLFCFSSSLAWILIWIMPVAVVGARLYFRRMRALTTEIRTIDGRINGHLQETLQHRVLVKTLGSIGSSEEELSSLQDLERDRTVSRLGYSALSRGFMSVGFSAGYLTAFIWGVLGLKDGSVTYGLMVAFLQMVGQVQRPVANLALYVPAFIKSLSSEERLLEIGELPQEGEMPDVLLEGAPGVRVTDLTFAYDGRPEPVFSGLSFDFKPGQMTVITGPTGEGKSTLAQLLLALLEPASGKIELYTLCSVGCGNGVVPENEASGAIPVAAVSISPATRCNFMYVPQGNSLLSGSVRANLLMARPSASDEELREVLHVAAADFVLEL
ncbi:MAG: ABC transporter ATP-binding protein, partial [Bacteroidales bacterium]|nr:ABC transporter ATP-binding protein [Bacteroidales bacterium]